MFAAERKTKSSELLDTLNQLSDDDKRNRFRLNALKREAESLIRSPASTAEDFVVYGGICAYLKDYQDTRGAFNNAFARAPNDFYVYLNYSTALGVLGILDESVESALQANEIRPGELAGIDRLIHAYTQIGSFVSAGKAIDQWDREKPNDPHDEKEFVKDCVSLLNKYDVSEDVISNFVKHAFAIVDEEELPFDSTFIEVLSDEYCQWISYNIFLNVPPESAFSASVLLFERLAETTLESESGGIFSIKFQSY